MCLFAILVKQDGKSGSSSGNHLDHGKQKKNDSKLFGGQGPKSTAHYLLYQ